MSTRLVKDIAKRLKAARKAAGFKSAKQFAVSQHIPVSTYFQHESGRRNIHADLLVVYSSKLQISLHWLLTGEEGSPLHQIAPEIEADVVVPTPLEQMNHHKLADLHLLRRILLIAEPLFSDPSIPYQELISYCFDVYDTVSTLVISMPEKEKIIHFTILSFKRGIAADRPMAIEAKAG